MVGSRRSSGSFTLIRSANATQGLGLVHGAIGGVEHLLGASVHGIGHGHPDTRRDRDRLGRLADWIGKAGKNALGNEHGVGWATDAGQQNEELITPVTRDEIAPTNALPEAIGDRGEHTIAHEMSPSIVDRFEAIQIDE